MGKEVGDFPHDFRQGEFYKGFSLLFQKVEKDFPKIKMKLGVKHNHVRQEKVELSLFTDDIVLYTEKS